MGGLMDLQHMSTNQGCVRYVISLTQIAANVNVFTILFIKYIIVESSMVTFSAIVYNLMGNNWRQASLSHSKEGRLWAEA